jgi:GNAT superfamily N-acetyltransferase
MSSGRTNSKRVPMTVTFLEMTQKPAGLPPPVPMQARIALLRCEKPTAHFYRYLYDTVGGPYLWVDRKKLSPESLTAVIQDPRNALYVLYADGAPAGLAELDLRKGETVNIAYFGLMPEAIGRRLGHYFLYQTVMNAWALGAARVTVNTCSLDHPRALPLYQRLGFSAYAREERFVELI